MSDQQVDRVLNAIEASTGHVPGFRRAHARGIGFHGRFNPTERARALTTAEHFQGGIVPVVVRLSNAGSTPYVPDRRPGRKGLPLGLAIRFDLASGARPTWAAASIPSFPARVPEDFLKLTEAQRADPKSGKPNVARLLAFVATHRHLLPAIKGIGAVKPPQSFATTRFNGLHAYYLVAPDGIRRAFRYRWVPDAGIEEISAQANHDWPPQYLLSEIKQRSAQETIGWNLVFQLAGPDDPVNDVTQQWPDTRETVVAGHLSLGDPHEDQQGVADSVFDPTNVVPGIELSDDPILHFRSRVYGGSYDRRSNETRPEITPE
jgi:catalase